MGIVANTFALFMPNIQRVFYNHQIIVIISGIESKARFMLVSF